MRTSGTTDSGSGLSTTRSEFFEYISVRDPGRHKNGFCLYLIIYSKVIKTKIFLIQTKLFDKNYCRMKPLR